MPAVQATSKRLINLDETHLFRRDACGQDEEAGVGELGQKSAGLGAQAVLPGEASLQEEYWT